MTNKLCPRCNIQLPLENFYLNNNRHSSWCKNCTKTYARTRAKNDPNKRKDEDRKHYWKKKYGVSVEQYNQLYEQQNGVCAICHQPETFKGYMLAVDHCHASSDIRGLLCRACNLGLGFFRDNITSLSNAINYLQKNPTQ